MFETEAPLITVGIVVLNREWIIGEVLNSILSQTYPHDRLFVLIVDGGSSDKTIEIAKQILERSDFCGFEIISKPCNIPEGRNICVEKMRGELLLFWDSDVLMRPDAVQRLVDTMRRERADIVTADTCFIYANSMDEAKSKLREVMEESREGFSPRIVPATMMGHTLIKREVFDYVRFDPDLTLYEDFDFSVRAREKGFKIVKDPRVVAFDINLVSKSYSDIFVEMPARKAIRGLRKKARAKVLSLNFKVSLKDVVRYFWSYKRYLFYLSYVPALLMSIVGLLAKNFPLSIAFPLFSTCYLLYQLQRRGFKRGLSVFVKSIVVGLPLSALMIFYSIKHSLENFSGTSSHQREEVCLRRRTSS